MNNMSLRNKVVLVTGASSGIGAAITKKFAKEGANIALVGRNETRLKVILDEINKNGTKHLVIKADLSKEDEARTVVKQTVETFGRLDILVNNSGIMRLASVLDDNILEIYDEVTNINLRACILLTNLAAPHLTKTSGNIINISSIAGTAVVADKDLKGFSIYCTSKAGLEHFSRLAAEELAANGVRVNVVSPGPVETEVLKNAGLESNWDLMASKTALKILTQPEEVADLVLYLASDKAKSVTGSNFTIDAGFKLCF